MHKFTVGQLVQFNPDRGERTTAPRGSYEVTKRLPHNGQEYEYRIKSPHEEHERTARESQLSRARWQSGSHEALRSRTRYPSNPELEAGLWTRKSRSQLSLPVVG